MFYKLISIILRLIRLHSWIDKVHFAAAIIIPAVTYVFISQLEIIDKFKLRFENGLFFVTLIPIAGKLSLKAIRFLDWKYPAHLQISSNQFIKCPEFKWSEENATYRIRNIKNNLENKINSFDEDLLSFVTFSESSATIALAHPELTRNKRIELCKKWYGANPSSFMILEKLNSKNQIEIVGVSIILSLTLAAKQALLSGETTVLQLRTTDFCDIRIQNQPNILIDTLIARTNTDGYIFTLLMRHLSCFWFPTKQKEITIIVEPDRNSLIPVLLNLGFRHSKFKASKIYFIEIPRFLSNRKLKKKYIHIKSKIRRCEEMPI